MHVGPPSMEGGSPFAVGECGRRVRPPPTAKGGLLPPFAVGILYVIVYIVPCERGGG